MITLGEELISGPWDIDIAPSDLAKLKVRISESMACSRQKPYDTKCEDFREKVTLLAERSEKFKNVSDAGLMSCLETGNKDIPLYLDGMLIKLSLTFCLKSENSSMRSIARSVLFQFMDYETSRNKLEEKLNHTDPVAILNNLKNNSVTFDSKVFLFKEVMQLFKNSILVIISLKYSNLNYIKIFRQSLA